MDEDVQVTGQLETDDADDCRDEDDGAGDGEGEGEGAGAGDGEGAGAGDGEGAGAGDGAGEGAGEGAGAGPIADEELYPHTPPPQMPLQHSNPNAQRSPSPVHAAFMQRISVPTYLQARGTVPVTQQFPGADTQFSLNPKHDELALEMKPIDALTLTLLFVITTPTIPLLPPCAMNTTSAIATALRNPKAYRTNISGQA